MKFSKFFPVASVFIIFPAVFFSSGCKSSPAPFALKLDTASGAIPLQFTPIEVDRGASVVYSPWYRGTGFDAADAKFFDDSLALTVRQNSVIESCPASRGCPVLKVALLNYIGAVDAGAAAEFAFGLFQDGKPVFEKRVYLFSSGNTTQAKERITRALLFAVLTDSIRGAADVPEKMQFPDVEFFDSMSGALAKLPARMENMSCSELVYTKRGFMCRMKPVVEDHIDWARFTRNFGEKFWR